MFTFFFFFFNQLFQTFYFWKLFLLLPILMHGFWRHRKFKSVDISLHSFCFSPASNRGKIDNYIKVIKSLSWLWPMQWITAPTEFWFYTLQCDFICVFIYIYIYIYIFFFFLWLVSVTWCLLRKFDGKLTENGYLALTQSLSSKLTKTKIHGFYVQPPQNSKGVRTFTNLIIQGYIFKIIILILIIQL